MVYARTAATEDVRAFIVERGMAGLSTGQPFKKMGMHSSPTGEVFLDDVFVPADQLVGGEDQENARAAAKSSLKGERFGMTPMCLGIVDRCLDESVRYAKERVTWGKPIATYQLVQEKIAKMYTARERDPGAADAAARGGPRGGGASAWRRRARRSSTARG